MSETVHYCGHPDRDDAPTICGIERKEGVETTTVGGKVTCEECLAVLDERK